ncbi:MAG: DEAD/DEAH box helicase family protein, partial [Aeromonadaceae bacterium]|nr:DEAD/DEAH box helicase family protein [Aeromonadaceae bacterium]
MIHHLPVRVALPVPLRRQFDYLAPAPLPAIGCRVRVSFGRQQLVGLVTDHPEQSDLPLAKLKPILEVLDTTPLLPPSLWQLLLWSAHYYQHPLGEVLQHALPVLLRQGEAAQRRPLESWQLTPSGHDFTPSKNAERQRQALQLLQDGPLPTADLREVGVDSQVLAKLAAKGVVEKIDGSLPQEPWRDNLLVHEADQHQLNTEQALAVASVQSQPQEFGVFLLDGVTGSGKTEVYLQLIAPVLARGQQVLVLVPEIGLTPQTLQRFRRRFAAPILTLHSGMNDRER